jgi:hypothetical protein
MSDWEVRRYRGTTTELYTVSRIVNRRRVHLEYASDGQPMLWGKESAIAAIASIRDLKRQLIIEATSPAASRPSGLDGTGSGR